MRAPLMRCRVATSACSVSSRVCQLPVFVIFTGFGIKAGTTVFVSFFSGGIIGQAQEVPFPSALLQPSCERRQEALQSDNCLVHAGVSVSLNLYLSLLLGCVNRKDLKEGRRIHAHIVERGLNLGTCLGNSLLDMYAKCGSMQEAEQVFHGIHDRNVVTWTMMIVGHSKVGQPEEAFRLFWQMKHEGLQPDEFTMVGILSACAGLKTVKWGKEIHSELLNSGLELNVIVGNTLMDMYSKCGSIKEAEQVFRDMFKRDVISWSTMILGYSQLGFCDKALSYYRSMLDEGMEPNTITLIGTLKACILLEDLETGRIIHISILKSMAKFEVTLENTLIDMYTKCGCRMDARRVLDRMTNRDTVSWNIIISGHNQQIEDDAVLKAYLEMAEQGVHANAVTFTNVLKACANQGSLLQGCLIGWTKKRLFPGMH